MSEQKSTACPHGTNSAKVIEVIKTETVVGTGTLPDDPYRILSQYWSLNGELLAENINPSSQQVDDLSTVLFRPC